MNVENILRVADAIEQHSIPDLGFNMSDFVHELDLVGDEEHDVWETRHYGDRSGNNCGTVACIAGWAKRLRTGIPATELRSVDWREEAEWLGLSPHDDGDGNELFFGDDDTNERLEEIVPAEAVAVLRHLAATGEVDWSIAAPSQAA